MASLEQEIRDKARELGFVACGFARADAVPEAGANLLRWIEDGRHGSMEWFEARAHHRVAPTALWPEARSVIALGMSYAPDRDPRALANQPSAGRISVYAQGGDYHKTVKKALKALGRWLADRHGGQLKVFVDTAPVMEKPLSAAAGIGWQGKHTNLVSRQHGSWLFLGVVMTSLELQPDQPAPITCGSCRRCLDACPTNAFDGPHRIDARKCISYLTIEHAGPIPEENRAAIGNRIYGCDDCLAVCPWNSFATSAAANRAFIGREELKAPPLADLLKLDDAAFRAMFSGSPIKRIGVNRMIRNCLVAAGNSGDGALIEAVRPHLQSEDPVVADAATWAMAALQGPSKECRQAPWSTDASERLRAST
ncbi:tRNA epoxyqueuosine(34) reductase QueG [Sphingomonas sinipercae]|uniref:Epoxyqueuosine reductase n=1 Tax=Sphingomonas sinipercae TaxID=2714944 RepID=A0A6G7ZLR1_9SPHN|nr:tRNA epoxyqueuosine(34) reductase QueG [Sphingomonas sinipercae]QIL01862.1 tRNA epoxyqueuosine(34) reductase QueG [Sphingomonas sinipercae]